MVHASCCGYWRENMRGRRFGPVVVLSMCAMAIAPVHNAAYAGVITTEQYLDVVDRQQALDRIDAVLAREEVQHELKRLGVDPAEAAKRVAALTDSELALLADNMESLPAGGDLLGVIGVVFIVLLILELVGVTNVFNKI
ncbi:MAG TPA: PA2779 family protein [Gammaproteobacteria bacterium]